MIDLAQLDISSPVSYLIAVLVPALDALIPVLPSETAVIALGVATAGSTDPRIAVLVALAALGAFLGDNAAYLVGRRFGPAVSRWVFAGERGERRRDWAQRSLAGVRHPDHRGLPVHPGRPDRGHSHLRSHRLPAAQLRARHRHGRDPVGQLRVLARADRRPGLRGPPWAGLLVGLGLTVAVSGVIEAARRIRAPAPPAAGTGPGPGARSRLPIPALAQGPACPASPGPPRDLLTPLADRGAPHLLHMFCRRTPPRSFVLVRKGGRACAPAGTPSVGDSRAVPVRRGERAPPGPVRRGPDRTGWPRPGRTSPGWTLLHRSAAGPPGRPR